MNVSPFTTPSPSLLQLYKDKVFKRTRLPTGAIVFVLATLLQVGLVALLTRSRRRV